ncbi:hypothetical protein F441_03085 [Phytophthora nicotianae CJ01A1]|uniref:MULE transposase domain-containing protein n=1 Tax=Phytophthora nicotianae CJ01A1 TaxID=1317063 RepID=W2XMH2_PHYNI|nr:hypothetical protein F441_03085 [Phytophthora nicotianae CJ01A1]
MACVPSVVMFDFEQVLHLGSRDQFESAHIVGCLFHWKQAIRRKLISLGIARVEVAAAMEPGVLDLLTVLPVKVLRKKGIPFVTKKLYRLIGVPREADRTEKWQAFWDYFVKTWCDTYDIFCWNISGMMKENVEIVNRTNNPLEAYNRRLADTFGAPHPSILNFVEVLKQEAKNYLDQLADVRHRRQGPSQHGTPYTYPCIPRLR